LFVWGGYEAGKQLGWWQRLHWPAWLHHLAIMKVVPQPTVRQNNEEPLTFMEVAAADDRSAPKRKVLFQPEFPAPPTRRIAT
jgi:hypothetical protein